MGKERGQGEWRLGLVGGGLDGAEVRWRGGVEWEGPDIGSGGAVGKVRLGRS